MILLAARTDPCPHHLGDKPAALACTSDAGHPYGHVYVSSDLPDGRHDDGVSDQ